VIPFETILKTYGYWAIFIGTFAEGETILILGGIAAKLGYLALPWVILAAFVGGLCGDQLFFTWAAPIVRGSWPGFLRGRNGSIRHNGCLHDFKPR
jgi:membrane protein DedA with SNARE-associated domain